MNSALLLESVDALIVCKDLEELARSAALLVERLLGAAHAVVILRGAEREVVSGAPSVVDDIRSWASEWLAASPASRPVSSAGRQAVSIDVPELDVSGVIAVSFEPKEGPALDRSEEPSLQQSTVEERHSLLTRLAQLAATCSGQIVRRTIADRTLQDTRALIARGLHDLCTPLNSLRLGMHLLEPALTTKDPAIAQRTHRAVDRMAALVTTMADAIGSGTAGGTAGGAAAHGQRPASVRTASQH
jgi:signal transduction histidine kinase